MQGPAVFNIQKYSIHDGDGIRTTIFFKGCPLHCGWCHNPESQNLRPELLWQAEKCTGCGECIKVCRQGAISYAADGRITLDREKCICCGECVEWCFAGAREVAGKEYTVAELVHKAEKDLPFYEQSGGGVTLSGGEVMAAEPFPFIVELAQRLCERGISVTVDTSGCMEWKRFEAILPYIETFLYDIKEMDAQKHREQIGADNTLILENLRRLSDAGAHIYLRLPLVHGVNDTDSDIASIIQFLKTGIHTAQINLLPYHNTGRSKYDRLGRQYDPKGLFEVPAKDQMEAIASRFRQSGFTNDRL